MRSWAGWSDSSAPRCRQGCFPLPGHKISRSHLRVGQLSKEISSKTKPITHSPEHRSPTAAVEVMLKAEQEKDKVAPTAGAKVQRHLDSAAYPETPSKPGEVNWRPSPAASTTGVVLVAPVKRYLDVFFGF